MYNYNISALQIFAKNVQKHSKEGRDGGGGEEARALG